MVHLLPELTFYDCGTETAKHISVNKQLAFRSFGTNTAKPS